MRKFGLTEVAVHFHERIWYCAVFEHVQLFAKVETITCCDPRKNNIEPIL